MSLRSWLPLTSSHRPSRSSTRDTATSSSTSRNVIADNTSSSRFVVGGRPRDLSELDLRTLGVVLEKNGEIMTMAAGAAVWATRSPRSP
jgi:2-keto-4-pentenoate hydratase